ncbi:MAG: restriction endonuclease subunit S [Bacteroidia bacterium]
MNRSFRIEDCCDILDSKRVPINGETRDGMKGNIPYYGANGIQGYINKYIFDEPLILMAEDGGNFDDYNERPICYKVEGKSWVNNHAHILRAKTGFNQEYIFYSLVHKNITNVIKGGTRSKLNGSELKNIQIVLPPLPQQKKIAKILGTVDAQIEATEKLIAKYEMLKEGLLHDLFTRGIDTTTGKLRSHPKQAPHLYKNSPLGLIPKEWEVKKLGEVTSYVDYRGRSPIKSDKGILLVTAKNIKFGFIDYEASKEYVEIENYEQTMSRGYPKIGDILFTTEAPLGNVAQVDMENIALAQRVIKFRCDKSVLKNTFLKHSIMSSYFQNSLKANSTGSTVEGIKGSKLHKISILTPSLAEQKSMTQRLDGIGNKMEISNNELTKLQTLKKGLMQDLLGGKREVSSF